MTLRYFVLGGATTIALGALSLGAMTAEPASAAPAAAPAQTMPLDKITNASAALARLRVENARGETIGTVSDVVTQSDGKAIAVSIDAGAYFGVRHRVVSIGADRLGLDQARHVLVTNLTKPEIKALPTLG